ncbi:hypothetical protein IM40_02725 [Candidatus Paracaedimonas acanthamoebae]|nr:hypothetical protein IM40_02725 [Candidatus Paracaedimonas acanthamoebae]
MFLILPITNIKTIASSSEKEELPIRSSPLNRFEDLQEVYTINGQELRRQNVSGQGMRCFFNAIGLEADIEIVKLRSKQEDPLVRGMIANEIISAAVNPEQLPREVKDAIDYSLYEAQRQELSHLQELRSDKLRAQSGDGDKQDPTALPQALQVLGQTEEDILKDFRKRASSIEAFNAFLDHHVGNEQMMVALHDVQGDEGGNENANLTSIDAIARINKIALRIYQPTPDGKLHLAHQYIPNGATQIAYLYHQGIHFQVLIPFNESEEPQTRTFETTLESMLRIGEQEHSQYFEDVTTSNVSIKQAHDATEHQSAPSHILLKLEGNQETDEESNIPEHLRNAEVKEEAQDLYNKSAQKGHILAKLKLKERHYNFLRRKIEKNQESLLKKENNFDDTIGKGEKLSVLSMLEWDLFQLDEEVAQLQNDIGSLQSLIRQGFEFYYDMEFYTDNELSHFDFDETQSEALKRYREEYSEKELSESEKRSLKNDCEIGS